MPYQINKSELDALGAALADYYTTAWQEGVRSLFDKMAQSRMGIATAYLDQAKDTFANLRKKSDDSFGINFKPALKQYVGLYLANKNDVASDLVTLAEAALKKLASHIPVPMLGSVVSAAIAFGAEKGRAELHSRSVKEADSQLSAQTKSEVGAFFTTDTEAGAFITKSMDQYKLICKFIQTLPASINSFEDAVTFPGSVFKVQAAASSLNVALTSIQDYVNAMKERMTQVQGVSEKYIRQVRQNMPAAVNDVLQQGYQGGFSKGGTDATRGKYARPNAPIFKKADKPGGATQLAGYLAHAVAQGYYDSGSKGPQFAGAPSSPRQPTAAPPAFAPPPGVTRPRR